MTGIIVGSDSLVQWSRRRRAAEVPSVAGIRFAFYGRVSTDDFQDPESSRRWQFDACTVRELGFGYAAC
jgi:hypothetical protein